MKMKGLDLQLFFLPPHSYIILFTNNRTHWFIINLVFYPGNNIQVNEYPGLIVFRLKLFDLLKKYFQFSFHLKGRDLESSAKKLKDLHFCICQVLHFGHEPVDRFGKIL